MPAYAGKLNEDEIIAVASYVEQQAERAGNPMMSREALEGFLRAGGASSRAASSGGCLPR